MGRPQPKTVASGIRVAVRTRSCSPGGALAALPDEAGGRFGSPGVREDAAAGLLGFDTRGDEVLHELLAAIGAVVVVGREVALCRSLGRLSGTALQRGYR